MMLNSDTSLFAVLGDPVSHSLSPMMHNRAFTNAGYNGVYLAFRVKDIGKAVSGIKALLEKTAIKDKDVVILGAGGAARAIGFGIISQGGRVTIINRTAAKGEKLARDLRSEFQPLSDFKKAKCQILINTTPVGMIPDTDAMPVRKERLEKSIVVMDVVYISSPAGSIIYWEIINDRDKTTENI